MTWVRVVLALAALVAAPLLAADVEVISHGDPVDLQAHLVSGKYVLFDFYADWCGPCRALEPSLRSLADQHPDRLVLRKVDIVNWNSAVSRQQGLRFVPFLKLYGPDGRLVREGDAGAVLQAAGSVLGGRPVSAGGSERPQGGTGGRGHRSVMPFVVLVALTGVVVFLVLGQSRRRTAPIHQRPANPLRPALAADESDDRRAARVWFVKAQGSLEGPFALVDLEAMVGRGRLARGTEVRRRGDAEWRTLGEVVDG